MTTITFVDAFASKPFEGNPAAVCLLDGPASDAWMRRIACETRMPATAFLHPADGAFALRWFASAIELELCGHGTLASAHVLWETRRVHEGEPARFQTTAGTLSAARCDGWIELDFPALVPEPAPPPDGLVEALGVTPLFVGRGRLDYLVEVDGAVVAGVNPDFERLRRVPTRGVIVTGRSPMPEFDFVSRFFAPSTGLDEDAVTGSAHCCLAPFWSSRLGRASLVARQLSARGGTVKATVAGSRVRLAGQAVTIARGELSDAALTGLL